MMKSMIKHPLRQIKMNQGFTCTSLMSMFFDMLVVFEHAQRVPFLVDPSSWSGFAM